MKSSDQARQEAMHTAVEAALMRLGWRTIISTVEQENIWDRVVLVPVAGPVMIRVAVRPTLDGMLGLAGVLAAQDFSHIILFSEQLPFDPPAHPRLSVFQTTSDINVIDVEAALGKLNFAAIS